MLKFHREALTGCAAAVKSASGAFDQWVDNAPARTAFGNLLGLPGSDHIWGAGLLSEAVTEVVTASREVSNTLHLRLKDVELALDAVERTIVSADSGAARR